MESVGDKIKNIRLSLGLTQSEFGNEIGKLTNDKPVLKGTVNNWEHDRNKPNARRRVAISKLGDVSVNSLQKDKDTNLYKILNAYVSINENDISIKTEEIVNYYKTIENLEDDDLIYSVYSFMNCLKWITDLKKKRKLNDSNIDECKSHLDGCFIDLTRELFKDVK